MSSISSTVKRNIIADLWSNIIIWLSNIFYRSDKNNDNNEEESKQDKQIREDKEEMDRVVEEYTSQTSLNVDSNKLPDAVKNFQFYEEKRFHSDGYEHGTKGEKDRKIQSSAIAKSNYIQEHTSTILQGRLKGLATKLKFKEKNIEKLEEDIVFESSFNADINNIKKKEPRHFSRAMAYFYLFAGVAMMIADFPISLSVATHFIDVPFEYHQLSFYDKVKLNPEVFLFALGITLLSLYYKVIYDEYINKSIYFKSIAKLDDGASQTSRSNIIIRLVVKLIILLSLICLLYNIGSLRNAISPWDEAEVIIQQSTPNMVLNYRLVSFICITILLPVLSGICLSLSAGIFSNIFNRNKSNEKIEELIALKEKNKASKVKIETVYRMIECLNEEWSHSNRTRKIDMLSKLFINAYYQGYKLGHRVKFEDDPYENALSLYIDDLKS